MVVGGGGDHCISAAAACCSLLFFRQNTTVRMSSTLALCLVNELCSNLHLNGGKTLKKKSLDLKSGKTTR